MRKVGEKREKKKIKKTENYAKQKKLLKILTRNV
jgi:hypothetical protein